MQLRYRALLFLRPRIRGWCLALRNSDHHTHQQPLRLSRDKLKLAERIVVASIRRKKKTYKNSSRYVLSSCVVVLGNAAHCDLS